MPSESGAASAVFREHEFKLLAEGRSGLSGGSQQQPLSWPETRLPTQTVKNQAGRETAKM